ncbi:hypothetical protein SAMN05216490_4288 [Mucilaginibacter mallensis]|uniref:Uncharacterized protein n=1 Tax=Mucilaginibacter mallensis TaxID=652787 RepID=A0A1H2BR51_MUCMA|nr:hypothetical protein [Mucilaginibacter mallensis]SDT60653.1 hypothetical protein SAMN05216490_4288 [Mucilaginibacter mallensis]
MKNVLLSLIAVLIMTVLFSFRSNSPVLIKNRSTKFKGSPEELGDFQLKGVDYAVYGDPTDGITSITFLGGPAVYSFSGTWSAGGGGRSVNVTFEPTSGVGPYSYNGPIVYY